MQKVRSAIKNLNMVIKLLITLVIDPIISGVYRICKGDVKGIIIGIVWILTCGLM